MSYTVKFYDKSEVIVSNEFGESIKEAIRRELSSFEIGDNLYKVSAISMVVKSNNPVPSDAIQLHQGDPVDRRADINSEAYKKFQEARKKIGRIK